MDKRLKKLIKEKTNNIKDKCMLDTYGGCSDMPQLTIRKLTETECYKLMGFTKTDSEKCSFQSASTRYHQAGDSLITTIIVGIVGKLVGKTDEEITKIIENYVESEIILGD